MRYGAHQIIPLLLIELVHDQVRVDSTFDNGRLSADGPLYSTLAQSLKLQRIPLLRYLAGI